MKRVLRSLLLTVALTLSAPAQAVPPIQQHRLDNGITVLLIEAHNVPMVAMQLTLTAGSRFDPAGKGGTASLLGAMLGDHTAGHDHDAWAALLDAEAIQLGYGVSRDTMSLSLTVVNDALNAGIAAMQESLLRPGWNRSRFKLIDENTLAATRKSLEEPRVRADDAASKLLFGDHPYGHEPDGTLETLEKIDLADLRKFYKAQVRPQGAVLAVSGDITMEKLLALIGPALSSWQGAPEQASTGPAPAVAGRLVTVPMPTTQTMSQFIRLGISRNDPDLFPLLVLNHLLGGGGFGSRLMEEVREKRGLVYGIYSYFVPLAQPGPFIITLQTRADQADQAEAVVRSVLKELAEGRIDGNLLSETKANLTGGFAQRLDSNRERVGLMGMIGYYGMPLDYLQRWTQRIESVTLADIQRVARQYLNPESWNLVRVGPATESNERE